MADSFTAVKNLVYDRKVLTMDELMEALDSNFAGERGEEIRRMCLKEFGGITGDLAGYFLQSCERNMLLVLAFARIFFL